MSRSSANEKGGRLGAVIEREIRKKTNVRFLNGLPAFQTDKALPSRLRDLLADLDDAERRMHR